MSPQSPALPASVGSSPPPELSERSRVTTTMFPVQATWSNDAAGGAGWCAGAGTDLPF